MSGNEQLLMGEASGNTTPEIFALTDEQILELEPEGPEVAPTSLSREHASASQGPSTAAATAAASARDDKVEHNASTVAHEPPGWLAREMKDPWVGDEARELWEGVQWAQREAAAYREALGTPEDARALKEIYPGGVAEAKSAAERARELAEIDAVFFGGAGKPAEELRAGRAALAEKLHAQDPVAFREMVEAGVRLLNNAGNGNQVASGEWRVTSEERRSLHSESQTARLSGRDDSLVREQQVRAQVNSGAPSDGKGAQPGTAVPQEVADRYREFERATNAELEKSVGGAIGRAMEAALPNLRQANAGREGPFGQAEGKQAPPLQTRLAAAVREEVETALRSDASLGEQVARVLSGRRLDEAARAQVVRLIDARAQQLVPGAVRRVVGSWTQATLGTRRIDAGSDGAGHSGEERRVERTPSASPKLASGDSSGHRNDQATAARSAPRGRVDYRKLSDEQILAM